ncbi:MAG: O-antigen ligase family protein [Pseudomonadota bacterium]
MKRLVPAAPASAGPMVALFGGLVLLALLIGLVGAIGGWIAQLLLLTLVVPMALLVSDYRIGLVLLIVLMPYANSRLIPQLGPLSIINLVLAGVCALYLLRMVLARMSRKPAHLPVERELLLFYVLPVTMAAVVGTMHLGEIPQYFLVVSKIEKYGLKEYWISHYFKTMLLVLTACIMGAAVVEYGKGKRFAVALAVSAVLFVLAMMALIAISGMSLDRLKDARSFLSLLGRHNNEAGVLLTTALGPMLFMHAHLRHRIGRLALGTAVGLVIVGILLTFSRGAFLGLVAIIAMYVLHFRRVKTALTVLALLVVAAALAPAAVYERLGRGLDERAAGASLNSETDELTAGRVYTWKQLAPEVLRSPVWGRGQLSTQWSNHVKTTWYNANHPHNMYLEILMDMGLIGAVAMFLFYRHVWRTFRRLGRDERVPEAMRGFFIGASAGLLSMLVYGLSNGHYYPAPEQIFYWVTVGLAFGYAAWLRQQAPAAPAKVVPTTVARGWRVPADRILRPAPKSWRPGA